MILSTRSIRRPVSRGAVGAVMLLLALAGAAETAVSQTSASRRRADAKSDSPKRARRGPQPITAQQEKAALQLARRHHPDLEGLLARLKNNSSRRAYEQAVRSLSRTSSRLQAVKSRDPVRYELELKKWKLQSRAQLLAVKVNMLATPELREQLQQIVDELVSCRLQLLQLERDRQQQRLAKIQSQLDQLQGDREQQVQRQMELLLRSANRRGRAKAAAGRPASRRKSAEDR